VRRALVFIAALLTACDEAPTGQAPAEFWTVADALSKRDGAVDFGGFSPAQLAALPGEPIPFRSPPFSATPTRQGPAAGIVVRPAYAEGQPAAYAIFEVWHAHPQPWVQPVWVFVSKFHAPDPGLMRLEGARNVFATDVTASFYSPFWKVQFVTAPGATRDTFKDAKSILDARLPIDDGPLVLCPIVPAGVDLARATGEPAPRHPFTGDALLHPARLEPRRAALAWVDGTEVAYFDLGPERASYEGDGLIEAPAYFFSRHVAGGLAPSRLLPAVLPPRSWEKSLVRRIDVEVTAAPGTRGLADGGLSPPLVHVFVPAGNAALAAAVEAEGFNVPPAAADIPDDVARRYLLRVATKADCFGDAARFPDDCAWLDSESALRSRLPEWRFHRSQTQLSIGVLQAEGALR
jgi:hypothetical protein